MKQCYIISYDIPKNSSYDELITTIKSYKTWAHLTESTWAIVTEKSASEIRDAFLQFIEDDGRLIVIKSGSESAWKNTFARSEWLKKYL